MTLDREDILPKPHKESRQCRPRPCPGLSFKLSSSVQPSTPVTRASFNSQLPIPELCDPPKAWTWPSLERWEGAAKFSHIDPFSLTHSKIIFLHASRAAEVINIHDCAAIKVRPWMRARPQPLFTVRPPQSCLWLC